MKRFLVFFAGSLLCLLPLVAQNTYELEGTPIDCMGGSDAKKAFDDNTKTYFSCSNGSYTWVGLDFGEPCVVSRVAYTPRTNYGDRMMLGVFEGANSPDFSDALPFYMITDTPNNDRLTNKVVNISRGFRYVRYVSPDGGRCMVSELRFFGHKGEGDDTELWRPTVLPLISIHIADNREVTSRSTYLDGTYTAIYPDDDDAQRAKLQADSLRIRGRGNASWDFPKKPYRLKLSSKKHLAGMKAKAKDWTLINNYGDKTLIRNLVAFETSRIFGLAWTPEGKLVDVMVNGEYKGTYQLCDQVEVHGDRVNVQKMDADDNEGDSIQGGYLLELDAYASGEPVWFTSGTYKIPITIKYPDSEDITREQRQWIQKRWNEMEQRVKGKNYADSIEGFAPMFDATSFIRHFLVGEYSGNTDTYWSVNVWKDRYDEQFHVGPVWDFDLAFENDGRTYPINRQSNFMALSGVSSSATGVRSFITRILKASEELLKEEWSRARCVNGLTPEHMLAFVDSLAQLADDSQQLNFTRWPILNTRVHQNFQALGSYEDEVEFMKQYMEARFAWMDKKIGFDERYTDVKLMETEWPEGVVEVGTQCLRLEGWAEGSVVEVFDMAGKPLAQNRVADFTTELAVPSGVCLVVITAPSGAVKRVKAYVW